MSRIVSIGSALQDIYLIDRDDFAASVVADTSIFGKLEIGTKVDIDKISYEIGGAGTSSATTFARTGHEAILFSNISKDPAGEAILAYLDEEGVDTSYISFVKKGTGISIILLDQKSHERTILSHRGASSNFANLSPNDLDNIDPDWLYISTLRGDLDTFRKFLEKSKDLDTKIMWNPGALEISQLSDFLTLLPEIDILLLNKSEASQVVPGKVLSELASHLSNYCQNIIITDGNNGGVCKFKNESYRFGVYEDTKAKDSTGAGDAFGSGFLSAFASGKSVKDSIIFASANSTSVISELGAKKGILKSFKGLHQMPIERIDL